MGVTGGYEWLWWLRVVMMIDLDDLLIHNN